jgi:hypothetical protein
MGLFRRDKPIHEQLAEAAGLDLEGVDRPVPSPAWEDGSTPARDGEQGTAAKLPPGLVEKLPGGGVEGGPGVHGLARTRRWDTMAVVEAPGLQGNVVHFVALPDGTLIVEEDEPDGALTPLADAVEASVQPPYRAEAARQTASRWAVGAVKIVVVEAEGLDGSEAELVTTEDSSTLTVDGRSVYASVPAFERAGEAHGRTYVVRAERLDGDLWQVEALPL